MVTPEKTVYYNSKRKEYIVWTGMKYRCLEKSAQKERYYNRGIFVCERWMIFSNFLEDMGKRPLGMDIDRIDNNKGYYKENCRWTTRSNNLHNKEPSRKRSNEFGIGVSFEPKGRIKKYSSSIKIENIKLKLGYFLTKEEASSAYRVIEKEWYGFNYEN